MEIKRGEVFSSSVASRAKLILVNIRREMSSCRRHGRHTTLLNAEMLVSMDIIMSFSRIDPSTFKTD